jgi:hypothetical protein
MEPFEVYRVYMALKLHFTTGNYNITKTKGAVKCSQTAFLKRKDLFLFRKLANKFSKKEVIEYFVSNFVRGDKFGGIWDAESIEVYESWKTKQQKLSYTFKNDISTLMLESEKLGVDPLTTIDGQHPVAVKLYLGKKISLETLIILDKLFNFRYTNSSLDGDIIWKDISLLIEKYRPFVKIDKERCIQLWNQEKGLMI